MSILITLDSKLPIGRTYCVNLEGSAIGIMK